MSLNEIVPILVLIYSILMLVRNHKKLTTRRRIEIDVRHLVKPVDLRKIDDDARLARLDSLK